MRKRRSERKAAKVARMLVSLDDAARQVRPWRSRRVQLAAVSAGSRTR